MVADGGDSGAAWTRPAAGAGVRRHGVEDDYASGAGVVDEPLLGPQARSRPVSSSGRETAATMKRESARGANSILPRVLL